MNVPAYKKRPTAIKKLIEKGKKSRAFSPVKPMLASLCKKPFSNPNWLFEIKWDGYRAVATIHEGDVTLNSRNNISLKKFYPLIDALERFKMNALLDGEIVVLDDEGRPNFQMLQQWTKEEKGTLCYMVFDLLWYEGYDLTGLPLIQRKKILENILPANNTIRYCDHVMEKGEEFYKLAVEQQIEGVIAKEMDSQYFPGKRTQDWLKFKNANRMEAIITGFTQGRNNRKHFGALILAQYEGDELKYIGHTGSGMDEKTIEKIYKKLQPFITDHHPFRTKPKTNMPATWVKPKLICEVKFQERTKDGILRIPIFLALRGERILKN